MDERADISDAHFCNSKSFYPVECMPEKYSPTKADSRWDQNKLNQVARETHLLPNPYVKALLQDTWLPRCSGYVQLRWGCKIPRKHHPGCTVMVGSQTETTWKSHLHDMPRHTEHVEFWAWPLDGSLYTYRYCITYLLSFILFFSFLCILYHERGSLPTFTIALNSLA